MIVEFVIPVRTYSEANLREHHMAKYRRSKSQKKITWIYATAHIENMKVRGIKRITFTRLGKRRLDPDNNAGSFKHVQDSLCGLLLIDDGDPKIEFHYEQEHSKIYGVRVKIEYGA